MMTNTHKQQTLCWDCSRCLGNCSWSSTGTPVEGWKAEPTHVKVAGGEYISSYIVYECPEFDRDATHGGMYRLGQTTKKQSRAFKESDPPTNDQLEKIRYIVQNARPKVPMFYGKTAAEATRWIVKYRDFVSKDNI